MNGVMVGFEPQPNVGVVGAVRERIFGDEVRRLKRFETMLGYDVGRGL